MQRVLSAGGGASVAVGLELVQSLSPIGRIAAPGRAQLDLARPDSIRRYLRELRPQLVVNAAAYTAVDQAEDDAETCHAVNGEAPGILAEEVAMIRGALLHVSTDYVFDGNSSRAYRETDSPAPINQYGQSKLYGERAVEASNAPYIVLRCSWLYASRGSNFVRTVLRLAREQPELRIVSDQIGCPTWARPLAQTVARMLGILSRFGPIDEAIRERAGTFHLCAAGQASWFELAREVLAIDPLRREHVYQDLKPIRTFEYGGRANRPRFSALDTGKIKRVFGVELADWRRQLHEMLNPSESVSMRS